VHLRIDSRQEPGHTWNVIGRRAGAGSTAGTGSGRIVLCAHYDTKFDTPGALDNGGGVATLLALAEHLSSSQQTLDLECIAFGNEDSGLPTGSELYARDREDRFGEIVATLNFDGVGHALDVDTVAIMTHSEAFRELVDGVKQDYPGLIWTDPWPQSDHSVFAWRGVPCLAFMSRAAWYLAHLRCDTIEWVSPARLAELVHFAAQVVESLQDRGPDWTRGPSE
jgi:aminopeptidase YwaD